MINKSKKNKGATGCFDFFFGNKNNVKKQKIEERIPTPCPKRKNKSNENRCNQEKNNDKNINKGNISNQKYIIKPSTPPSNIKNIKTSNNQGKTNLNTKTNGDKIDKNLTNNNCYIYDNSKTTNNKNKHTCTIFGLVLNGSLARRAMHKTDYKSQKIEKRNLMLKRDHTFILLEKAYAKNSKIKDEKEIIKLKERIDTLKLDIIGYTEKIEAINAMYY